MSTAELRISIGQLLDGITDDSVLHAVYAFLAKASSSEDWYANLSDESKASIARGLEDAEKGRFVSQSSVQKRADKILGRK